MKSKSELYNKRYQGSYSQKNYVSGKIKITSEAYNTLWDALDGTIKKSGKNKLKVDSSSTTTLRHYIKEYMQKYYSSHNTVGKTVTYKSNSNTDRDKLYDLLTEIRNNGKITTANTRTGSQNFQVEIITKTNPLEDLEKDQDKKEEKEENNSTTKYVIFGTIVLVVMILILKMV